MCDQDHFEQDLKEFEARGLVTRKQFGVMLGAGVAMLLPKVANPKAITNSRFLLIMLTSCVLRRIALLATALSWPSVILAGTGKIRSTVDGYQVDHLFHRLIDDLEIFALQEQNGRDSAAVLHVGNRTQRAKAGGFSKRLLDRLSQRNLRLGHRRALRLGSG